MPDSTSALRRKSFWVVESVLMLGMLYMGWLIWTTVPTPVVHQRPTINTIYYLSVPDSGKPRIGVMGVFAQLPDGTWVPAGQP